MSNPLFELCEQEDLDINALKSCLDECIEDHFLEQRDGSSAFHILMENETISSDHVQIYLNAAPEEAFDLEDDYGDKPLSLLCAHGYATPGVVDIILQKGADAVLDIENGNNLAHVVCGSKAVSVDVLSKIAKQKPELFSGLNDDEEVPIHLLSKNPNVTADMFNIIASTAPETLQNETENKDTATHFICSSSGVSVEMLRAILTAESGIMQNNSQETPLHSLCGNPSVSPALIETYLKICSDAPMIGDETKSTPLHRLVESSNFNVELFETFTKIAPKSTKSADDDGNTPLHFLAEGADVNPEILTFIATNVPQRYLATKNADGETFLDKLMDNEVELSDDMKGKLRGMDDGEGSTIADRDAVEDIFVYMYTASTYDHLTFSQLLDAAIETERIDDLREGTTVFHSLMGSKMANPQSIKLFFAKIPAVFEILDISRNTPLHTLSANKDVTIESYKVVVSTVSPAVMGTYNSSHMSPLRILCSNTAVNDEELLMFAFMNSPKETLMSVDRFEKRNPPSALAKRRAMSHNILRWLMDTKIECLNLSDVQGFTCLHLLFRYEKTDSQDIFDLISKVDAEALSAAVSGPTPLHKLCGNTEKLTVESLSKFYERSSKPFLMVDTLGYTPLHLLCENPFGSQKMIEYYIKHAPAACSVGNSNGDYAMHLICGSRKQRITPKKLDLIIRAAPESAKIIDQRSLSPLHHLVSNKTVNKDQLWEMVLKLIPIAPSMMFQVDQRGNTPLYMLMMHGDVANFTRIVEATKKYVQFFPISKERNSSGFTLHDGAVKEFGNDHAICKMIMKEQRETEKHNMVSEDRVRLTKNVTFGESNDEVSDGNTTSPKKKNPMMFERPKTSIPRQKNGMYDDPADNTSNMQPASSAMSIQPALDNPNLLAMLAKLQNEVSGLKNENDALKSTATSPKHKAPSSPGMKHNTSSKDGTYGLRKDRMTPL